MKARITIIDDHGNTLEGDVELVPSVAHLRALGTRIEPRYRVSRPLDFGMQERAFIKRNAAGLSGPKKFVLLVAYLAKGNLGREVLLKDVAQHWNRMTAPSLLGGKFNRFYSNSSRENDWVETKKPGVYSLRPSWHAAIKP